MRRLVPTIAGAGIATLIFTGATIASGSSFTLRVRKDVHVTNAPNAMFAAKPVNIREAVAVGPAGYAVYTFQGETSHHFICRRTSNPKTNCWAFWPPVAVASSRGLSKQAGIHGRLATVRRHGILQLTLNGRPLYYFTPDLQSGRKHMATGDELATFGSIWHIVLAGRSAATSAPTPSGTGGAGGGGYAPAW